MNLSMSLLLMILWLVLYMPGRMTSLMNQVGYIFISWHYVKSNYHVMSSKPSCDPSELHRDTNLDIGCHTHMVRPSNLTSRMVI